MGTNFYLYFYVGPHPWNWKCIHLGKESAGWKFTWNLLAILNTVQEQLNPSLEIRTVLPDEPINAGQGFFDDMDNTYVCDVQVKTVTETQIQNWLLQFIDEKQGHIVDENDDVLDWHKFLEITKSEGWTLSSYRKDRVGFKFANFSAFMAKQTMRNINLELEYFVGSMRCSSSDDFS